MASRAKSADSRRPAPRLYLMLPQARDPDGLATAIGEALATTDVAAMLLRGTQTDERTRVEQTKSLGRPVQENGTAFLIDGDPHLALRCGADGAHLNGLPALQPALGTLKPGLIAGCGGLATRHDAMLAAEAGADYVMFGEPDPAGHRASFDAVTERVAWWAELFEVPCVGFAVSLDEVEPLAAAGADFVALGDCVFADVRGCSAALGDAARRLARAESVP